MANYTLIDLFAGAGGLSRGFMDTGAFESILAIEKDPDARMSYAVNFHHGDNRCVLPNIIGPDPRALNLHPDVIIGGPPCQDFTQLTAVRAKQTRERNELLWQYYLDWVLALRPKVFVIENVPNLLTDHRYKRQRDLLKARLSHTGYTIVWGLLTASNFGVPQSRQRAFVIGTRLPRRPFLPLPTLETHTAFSAIEDLANVQPSRMKQDKQTLAVRELHIGRSAELLSRLRYRYVLADGNRMHIPAPVTIRSWVNKAHGTSDGYGRVFALRPSSTIRCEGFKPEKGRFLHPCANRPLTPAEMARIQTFPDDHRFHGTYTSIAHQIGNAVPPKLAQHVARAVLELLDHPAVEQVPRAGKLRAPIPGGHNTAHRVLRLMQQNAGLAVHWREIERAVRHGSRSGVVRSGVVRSGVVDWGTPLRELVDDGYNIQVGPADGLPRGYYRLMPPHRKPAHERPAVNRLFASVLKQRTCCEKCDRTDHLEAALVRAPEAGGLLLPDNVEVLCADCRSLGKASSTASKRELEVYAWLCEYRHYPPIAAELFAAAGLARVAVTDGRLPNTNADAESVLYARLEKAAVCDLCDATNADSFRAEFVRPLAAGGLAHPDNVWVLCSSCRSQLAEQTIKVPTPGAVAGDKDEGRSVKLTERFAEPGFMTLSEAKNRNWLLQYGKDLVIKQRAQRALLYGHWEE